MLTKNLKRIALVLSLSAAIGTALPTRQSHAVAAFFTGGATAAAGGVLLSLGIGAGVISAIPLALTAPYTGWNDPLPMMVLVGISLLAVTGIVLLDETGNLASLQELSPQTAERLQITAAERLAYNSEIEEINALTESAALDLQAKLSPAQIAERYEGVLSAEARAAAAKVLKGTLGKAKTAAK